MINKVEICGVNTTKLPILSNEEKKELLLKIKNGDKDAREKFINGNLRLVLSVVQRFSGRAESAFQWRYAVYGIRRKSGSADRK